MIYLDVDFYPKLNNLTTKAEIDMKKYENQGSKDTCSGFGAKSTELVKNEKWCSTLCRRIGSLKFDDFKKPPRKGFFQIGIAEAND